MEGNTGGTGRPDDASRPLFAGEAGGGTGRSYEGPAGGTGREYDLGDPLSSFVEVSRALVTRPTAFFRDAPRGGSIVPALVFGVVWTVLSALVSAFISLLFSIPGVAQEGAEGLVGVLLGLILTPVFVVVLFPVFMFIWAGILHLLVMLFVQPTNAGFGATFKAASYPSVIGLVSWLPLIGGLIAFVWGIVLTIFGVREMHDTSTGRAALVVLLPAAVILLIIIVLAVVIGLTIFSLLQQGA